MTPRPDHAALAFAMEVVPRMERDRLAARAALRALEAKVGTATDADGAYWLERTAALEYVASASRGLAKGVPELAAALADLDAVRAPACNTNDHQGRDEVSHRVPHSDQTAVVGHPPEHTAWPEGQDGLAPIVHSTARIEAFVSIDAGIDQPTRLGARSWMLKHSHLGHDAVVGDDCVIATGAVVGGYAQVGDGAQVGLNATILPYRVVGAGARVGAGAVVTKDVPPGAVVVGNPARVLEPEERDFRPHNQRPPQVREARP